MQVQSDHEPEQPGTGGDDGDDDAVWRDLVARLTEPEFMDEPDAGRQEAARAVPATPPLDGTTAKTVGDFDPLGVWEQQPTPAPAEPSYGPRSASSAGREGADDAGPRDYDADDLAEEFVPAEPPSLAGADPAIVLSWIGAAGGPIFLVLAAIFWRGIPLLGVIGVIIAFLVGTGYLLFRLPRNRDHDSGDGAVV
ncbi:MAG: hypothetical protein WBX27_15635 [Specibacter sp.]